MIHAEYIESGTFQAGEEDVSNEGIGYGDEVVIMTISDYNSIMAMLSSQQVEP